MKFIVSLLAASLISSLASAANGPVEVDRIVAVVNSEVITRSDLRMRVAQVTRQLSRQGTPLPAAEVLEKQVLERQIMERLQLQLAAETSLRIDDVTLDRAVGRIADTNRLSMTEFRKALERDGISWDRFREEVRNEMLLTRVREREVDGRIVVSDAEVSNFLAHPENAMGQDEYNLSHILFRAPEGATPEQLARLRAKADDVAARIGRGEPFDKLAASYSDAPDALTGGNLGSLGGGQIGGTGTANIDAMTTAEIAALTTAQIQGLSTAQIRVLGTDDAGIVLVAIAIFNIIETVAELGCGTGLVRMLSRDRARREAAWDALETEFTKSSRVEGVIFGRVKGGFTVDLSGAVAFLPGSQVDIRPVRDVTPLMDIPQPFQILKMDRKRGNIVVSRRAILEETRAEARTGLISTLAEGQVIDGIVKNITDYGAFVDLGGIDGLLHISDMSWTQRVKHPSELYNKGDEVEASVLNIDTTDGDKPKISLGIKQMEGDNDSPEAKQKAELDMRMLNAQVETAEAEAMLKQADAKLKLAKAEAEAAKIGTEDPAAAAQMEAGIKQQEIEVNAALEREKMERDFALKQEALDKEFALKRDAHEQEMTLRREQAAQDQEIKQQDATARRAEGFMQAKQPTKTGVK